MERLGLQTHVTRRSLSTQAPGPGGCQEGSRWQDVLHRAGTRTENRGCVRVGEGPPDGGGGGGGKKEGCL